MNATQDLYGDDRLQHVLAGLHGCDARSVVDRLVDAVRSFVGEAPQWDDMTIVVVRRVA
jgi:sigma-B regulation protein RsbU (phosphoserine phosphatase)